MDSVRNPSARIESGDLSDMKVVVLGDTAVAHGLWTNKSTTGGKDTSSRSRWTDRFVRRDGRWQCVGSYSARAD
jgi:ketosteroid isomerase-like protein